MKTLKTTIAISFAALLGIAHVAFAANPLADPNPSTTVTLNLMRQNTLTLSQAKVLVAVDTTINPSDLSTTLGNLSLIKDNLTGQWTLKSVKTASTASGLIDLKATLQNIMPLGSSNNAYAFAKAESTPGETFTVESIEPYLSTENLSKANQALSLELYRDAMSYQTQLSMTSGLVYHISKINFYSATPIYTPGPLIFAARMSSNANDEGNSGVAHVAQDLKMSAEVTLEADASASSNVVSIGS